MNSKIVDSQYLREFFKVDETPEGDAELTDIEGRLVRVELKHLDVVCHAGDAADGMFFIESGMLEVLDGSGEQVNVMHEGQCFGEYAVLSGQKRLSTVRAQGKCILFKMNNTDVMEIMGRHPALYGDMMKNVYSQVSSKHSQVLVLSRLQRGILQAPENRTAVSPKKMLIFYGSVLVIMLLSVFLIPNTPKIPLFALPLGFMIAYALITKRTIESLVASTLFAALLVFRTDISVAFTDALMETMESPDNVFTVLVMALIGSVTTLIEASGAVTAFGRIVERKASGKRSVMLMSVGIMAFSSIDDCLNITCASNATGKSATKYRIPREEMGFLYSFLPTVLCSFVPLSLWGIFVVGTMNVSLKENTFAWFCKAIPFNIYSILTVIAAFLLIFNFLPKVSRLKKAERRVEHGGELWPANSLKYLTDDEPQIWGKRRNLFIPIIFFIFASFALSSLSGGSFMVDSACGLVAALIVMFFLYCSQSLMSPEEFMEYLFQGIQNVALPIVLYLLTICFSCLLDGLQMENFFDLLIETTGAAPALLPFALFVGSMFLTWVLGSSWAAYAIAFPIGLKLCALSGASLPLCIGAICAAGIAGEKNCFLTADAVNVGSMIGCNPEPIKKIRIRYSLIFTGISAALYLILGFVCR